MEKPELKKEFSESSADISDRGSDVLIFSEYKTLNEHSIHAQEDLNSNNVNTKIISSDKEKGIRSSWLDLLLEPILFFATSSMVWGIGKFLDWLLKESKEIRKKNKETFKDRNLFFVRCPIATYDKKTKKLKKYVYTGEINDVVNEIKYEFKIK